jgi:hypothetical protein
MCDDKAMPDCEKLVAQPESHIFMVSRTFRWCGSSDGWKNLFPRMEHECEMECSSMRKMGVSIIDMTTRMQGDARGGVEGLDSVATLNFERGALPHKTIGR